MNQNESRQTPNAGEKRRKIFYRAAVCLLFAALSLQLWFHAVKTSVTVDEAQHIFVGYRHWQCADFAVNPEHPPLLKLLAAAPLNFHQLVEPPIWECGARPTSKTDALRAGFSILARNDADAIVAQTRLAASLMTLLLAALVFLAAREMFGRAEAITALALFAFEPNIVAHGSLVTTDMAVSAGIFAAVYAFYRYLKNPSAVRFLILGAAIGLALATKHSGVLIFPILFLLLIAELLPSLKLENRRKLFRLATNRFSALAGGLLIGLFFLWACYGFNALALPKAGEETVLNEVFPPQSATGKPPSVLRRTLKTVSKVFPESYTVGLADVVSSSSRPMFLLGEVYPTGRWFYFPVAFSIKSSIALLVLLPTGLFCFALYRKRGREMLFLLVPPLVLLAASLASEMNIGVRHILPVYPFLIVIVAAGAFWFSRKYKIIGYALILLLVYHAFAAAKTTPNYLAFSNDLWGGTNNTYRLLADSNVEWGQNLKLVNEYLAREKAGECWYAGFGGGELARRNLPCRSMPGGHGWNATEEPTEAIPSVIEGTVLLSVAVLPPLGGDEYVPVLQAEPVAQIGGSVFVYRGRFEVPLAAALSHSARAERFLELNRPDEAVADARHATVLAPEDARTHFTLGVVLARKNLIDEAKGEFETTIRLAQTNPKFFRQTEDRAKAALADLNSKQMDAENR